MEGFPPVGFREQTSETMWEKTAAALRRKPRSENLHDGMVGLHAAAGGRGAITALADAVRPPRTW